MSWSAAQIIAPVIGSRVIDYGGFSFLWWVLAIVSSLTAGGYFFIYKFTKSPSVG
jgi:predicted MFS family arabinose efflux permease